VVHGVVFFSSGLFRRCVVHGVGIIFHFSIIKQTRTR
jgi:hypothetical protein